MNVQYKQVKPDPLNALTAAIAERKVIFRIYSEVANVLKDFDGKKITKALATAVEKKTGLNTYYGAEYSWFSLKVWGPTLPFKDRIDLNLGYTGHDGNIFNYAQFVDSNGRYSLDETRIPELEAEAAQIGPKLDRYKAALAEIEAASEALENCRCYVTV